MAALNMPAREELQRQHRVPGACLDDQEADRERPGRPRPRPRPRTRPTRSARTSPRQGDRARAAPSTSIARQPPRPGSPARPRRDQDRRHRDRQVDQEDPAPRGVVDERAADERAGRGGDRRQARPGADRPAPVRGRERAPGSSPGCPASAAPPPTPCSRRATISTRRGRQPAQQRGDGEPDDAQHEHPPPPEPVAEGPAEQDQGREGEQVAVDDPLQLRQAASRSLPIVRSATLTTVPSSTAMPEPRTAARITARPVREPSSTPNPARAHSRLQRVTKPRSTEQRLVGARRPDRRRTPADRPRNRRLQRPRSGDDQRALRPRPRLHGPSRARG